MKNEITPRVLPRTSRSRFSTDDAGYREYERACAIPQCLTPYTINYKVSKTSCRSARAVAHVFLNDIDPSRDVSDLLQRPVTQHVLELEVPDAVA